MLEIFQFAFIQRGLVVGLLIALIAPLIGIFLVLRRYSLIADTLSHVSLAGVALGLLLNINPLFTALITTTASSLVIERLRVTKKVYGESALALFLSGGLALALVLISLAHGFKVDLFSYLFGSILTVKNSDVILIALLSLVVISLLLLFYKELVYITFDEEAAQVSGISTKLINIIFIFIVALAIALSIPVIGILLISALIVIPVVTALQLKQSFKLTIIYAEIISVISVLLGLIISFYLDISTSGTIVLLMLAIFLLTVLTQKNTSR
jgi:zinc transport system permease protein